MMDSKKAKEALGKAMMAKAVLAAAAEQAAAEGPINPEIQAMNPALQPMDGYVNPMGRMGTVPPAQYSPGNMMGGNPMMQFVNPEAM
jgi:hypothetical protein|tara:strand:- start:292 stop:552 length:261 start_codon:yes stop_codon:yes gene_type:complete